MSISEEELLRRDSDRNIGDKLLQMIRELKAGKNGRKFEVEVSPIVMARHKIGHSQVEFAKLLGISLRTVQEWEQGRRQPSGAAKSLIAIAIKRPDILKEVLAA